MAGSRTKSAGRPWSVGRVLFMALLLLALPQPILAATAKDAEDLVRMTTEQMLAVLRAERDLLKAKPERIYYLVDGIVLPHFDFVRMSRWVLGKHWRSATRSQRTRFVRAFKTLLVRTYATALLAYSDERVQILPVREARQATRATVRTEIRRSGGPPIPINYNMYLKDGLWKVHDVTIDGISLVTNYRSTFGAQIQRMGLDGLIQRLEAHNAGVSS